MRARVCLCLCVCVSRMSQRYKINEWGVSRSAENDVPRVEITAANGGRMDLDGVSTERVFIFKYDRAHERQWREAVARHGGDANRPFHPHYFVIAPNHPVMLKLYPTTPLINSLPFSLAIVRVSSDRDAAHAYADLLKCASDILYDPQMIEEFVIIEPVPFFQLPSSLPALLF